MSINTRSIFRALVALYQDNNNVYKYSTFILLSVTGFFFYQDSLSSIRFSLYIDTIDTVAATLILSYLSYFLIRMAIKKHPSPVKALLNELRVQIRQPKRIISFLLLFIAINLILSLYTSIKSTIGAIYPFQLDLTLHNLDKLIHFETVPWQFTHALFPSPYASSVINILYNLWFFIVWGTLLVFMLQPKASREKFLISFISCWIILGGVIAILLASSGPCYLALLENNSMHYQPLFQRLAEQNQVLELQNWPQLWALETQQALWQAHTNNTLDLGSGISAMPSMHVSMATLMALGVSAQNRALGWLFWIYALAILIGSVHLGWHYAVDGYASIVATIVIWTVVNRYYDKHLL